MEIADLRFTRGQLVEELGADGLSLDGAQGRVVAVRGELVKVHLEPHVLGGA